jgi:hypothetical protein
MLVEFKPSGLAGIRGFFPAPFVAELSTAALLSKRVLEITGIEVVLRRPEAAVNPRVKSASSPSPWRIYRTL